MSDRIERAWRATQAAREMLVCCCQWEHRNCRLRDAIDLGAIIASTTIEWRWRADPEMGAFTHVEMSNRADCRCGIGHARKLVLALLVGTEGMTVEIVADSLAVALGPGRRAAIEVVSPRRPHWLPLELLT